LFVTSVLKRDISDVDVQRSNVPIAKTTGMDLKIVMYTSDLKKNDEY